MKIPKLSPKQQIIVIGVIFGVLILLFIIIFDVPQILRMGALGAEEQTALQELNNAKSSYSQLEELKKSSRKTEVDLLRQDRRVPPDAELPALLIQLQDIAAKSGTGFPSLKPSEPVQMEEYKEVPLELEIDGYFFSLMDFIYRLEKSPRLTNVTYLAITEGKQGLPNIKVILKGSAYIMTPGVKGTKSPGSQAPEGSTGGTSSSASSASKAASSAGSSGGAAP